MSFLAALRNGVADAWLKFVKALNLVAASIFGGIVLFNQAYPQGPLAFGFHVPAWAQAVGGVLWFSIVHYALTKAKPNA
jgi:hypothetical protein